MPGTCQVALTPCEADPGVFGETYADRGVWGIHTGPSGTRPGVEGDTNSTESNASAVLGKVTSEAPGGYSAGVRGLNLSKTSAGVGVYGKQFGTGYGVYGYSLAGRGVVGDTGGDGYGVYGHSANGRGVVGRSDSVGESTARATRLFTVTERSSAGISRATTPRCSRRARPSPPWTSARPSDSRR